jgi:hypothetical protein
MFTRVSSTFRCCSPIQSPPRTGRTNSRGGSARATSAGATAAAAASTGARASARCFQLVVRASIRRLLGQQVGGGARTGDGSAVKNRRKAGGKPVAVKAGAGPAHFI